MFAKVVMGALLSLAAQSVAFANATIPTKDIAGAKDNPAIKRYEGSFIVSYQRETFTDFKVPLSSLEPTERRDAMNNKVHAPKKEMELEGAKTRLVYLIPSERSPLEVSRNYEDVAKAAGGEILFSCKGETCGGDPNRSSSGGGGDSSLMMYFLVEKELKDASYSNGACAQTSDIADQRFFTARIPQSSGDIYVTVHTYKVSNELYCKEFNDRTVALVHILEPKAREQKMVVVKADEMARTIEATGRIALYGIFFDTDKTDLKPESTPTLTEIAQMMKANPKLAILVVGHTDKQGAYEYNIDLSRRRADAVVKALAASHSVDAKRMRGAGVGMLAPAATNDTEEGRAKNRRVEIVKLN
jgi:outer membrane protein OmpA-like peptidoglycan-associated protein